MKKDNKSGLLIIPGVGKATVRDLNRLGIFKVEDLKNKNPEKLYEELSGFYSVISMGAVIQTLWLVTTAIGMGMQFISTPGEIPAKWNELADLLGIPEDYELAAVFRMGYVDPDMKRPAIDWRSSQRKEFGELAFSNRFGNAFEQ